MSLPGPQDYTVSTLVHDVAAGRIAASAVLEAQLAEVERREPVLGAIVTDMRERARERAAALDARIARGEDPGPLAGVPIGLKDILDVAGLPTTGVASPAPTPPWSNGSRPLAPSSPPSSP
jgi:aspartyl-tRNA(Asn)/glutamyl-tRNA(Gln) amidotransferase subunit A